MKWPTKQPITIDGVYYSTVNEACNKYGTNYKTARDRVKNYGMTLEDAIKSGKNLSRSAKDKEKRAEFTGNFGTRAINVNGKTYVSQKAAAEAFGLDWRIVHQRIKRDKMSLEEALGIEYYKRKNEPIAFDFQGKSFKSAKEAALEYGVAAGNLRRRLNDGWDYSQALEVESRERRIPGTGYLYKISCLATEKLYIGVTSITPESRFYYHIKEAINNKTKRPLAIAIREYGPNNFKIETLEKGIPINDLSLMEKEAIIKFNSLVPNGYNVQKISLAPGGAKGKEIIVAGESFRSISAAARAFGVDQTAKYQASYRLRKKGWTVEQAFGLEPPPLPTNYKPVTFDNKSYTSHAALAREYGIDPEAFQQMVLRNKQPIEAALGLAPKIKKENSRHKKFRYKNILYNSRAEWCRHYNLTESKVECLLRKGKTLQYIEKVARFKSKCKVIEHDGIIFESVAAFSRHHNISACAAVKLFRTGKTPEEVIDRIKNPQREFIYKGVRFTNKKEWCRFYSIPKSTFERAQRNGLRLEIIEELVRSKIKKK
jgi:group I intron endonuclease